MGKSVKIPDPVYQRLSQAAEQQDVSRGAIVREWMEKAEKYDEFEADRRGR